VVALRARSTSSTAHQIEAKLFELRDTMEEQGYDEAEIERKVQDLRRKLEGSLIKTSSGAALRRGYRACSRVGPTDARARDTHMVAQEKAKQMEVVASAFGMRGDHQVRRRTDAARAPRSSWSPRGRRARRSIRRCRP
jgi:hypothetical protein